MNFFKITSMLAAYQCYLAGQPVTEIARQAHKSPRTIYRWIATVRG